MRNKTLKAMLVSAVLIASLAMVFAETMTKNDSSMTEGNATLNQTANATINQTMNQTMNQTANMTETVANTFKKVKGDIPGAV